MKRALALALVFFAAAPRAWAADEDDEEEAGDEEASDEDSGDDEEAEAQTDEEEEEEIDDDGLPAKQNLTGHDLDADKKPNEFERDRFFVDKVDTEKTEEGTLVQGSLASSTFFYGESGGAYPNLMVGENAGPKRLFTELRLQPTSGRAS